MEKTRLGISTALLGAIIFFAGMIGGLTPVLLLAGYVLLMENDAWLRKTAVKALVVTVGCAAAVAAVGLLPTLGGALQVVRYTAFVEFIEATTALTAVLTVAQKVLLLVMGVMALCHKDPGIAFVDRFVDKNSDIPDETASD